jgi:spermidine dehydrogenase
MNPWRTPDGIQRRDFINGLLVAAGGLALHGLPAGRARADGPLGEGLSDGGIGSDPRALRGGNLPSVFNVGHWLRDGRLTFSGNSVCVAPASYDDFRGTFPVRAADEADVVVVGSGLSGLATAFFTLRQRPGTRLLLLDANPIFGGNAGRDDAAPIPVISATGGAYAVAPFADFLHELYAAVGIDWTQHIVPDPFYSYFFDDRTPYARPGARGWNVDTYGAGLADVPYDAEVVRDLKQARQDFRNWYNRAGAPTDPADNSDPRFDHLAQQTLHDYLTVTRGYHPAVSDFYTRYSIDALSGTTRDVSAYTGISFLGSEYNPLFTFPGGTSGLARHILKWLVPAAIDGSSSDELIRNPLRPAALDRPGQPVRVRQTAMALRADTSADSASVVYFQDGCFWRSRGRAVVLAGQGHTARHLVEHLIGDDVRAAWKSLVLAPGLTANVSLRRARPLLDLGLGFNQYFWGSTVWADFSVADWISPRRFDPDRPTVLTFYDGNERPPEEMAAERTHLLRAPFAEYEDALRADLGRVLADTDFDFDRDVSAIYVYRWGHGLVYPRPGTAFGPPLGQGGQSVRTPAPRHLARAPLGRISFAGQDVESSPAVESALGSGLRAAAEALARL